MSTPSPSSAPTPLEAELEADLLARLRAGEDGAYEELLHTHGGRLLAVARRMLANEEDARDAFQEAMLSAFKAIDRFQGQSRLGTWLHRILVNAALMRLRSARRRKETPIEDMLPEFTQGGHFVEPASSWSEPADAAMQRAEVRQAVRDSIDRLPDNYRTALVLRDIEELGNQEIAEMLGLTSNAVKIRVHRARQALRDMIDPVLRPIDS